MVDNEVLNVVYIGVVDGYLLGSDCKTDIHFCSCYIFVAEISVMSAIVPLKHLPVFLLFFCYA